MQIIFSILFLSLGVSMDALAVAIERGISVKHIKIQQALLVAFMFGAFQTIMPIIGVLFGVFFRQYIAAIDHWIAFLILSLIGAKMICESFGHNNSSENEFDELKLSSLFFLAIATSIDSLAVGVSLVFMKLPYFAVITAMGLVTFCLSLIGVYLGKKLTHSLGHKAEFFGGLVLVIIGTKILIEHTLFPV